MHLPSLRALAGKSIEFLDFGRDLFRSRRIILTLAANDFRNRYLGSYIGLAWAVIHPVATVFVLVTVFSLAFDAAPIDNVPFALWLVAGFIPWLYFAEVWSGATSSIADYSYLVKKVVFRVSMLPVIKLVSALPIHIFLLIFTTFAFIVLGHPPGWHSLQVLYYSSALLVFLLGLSWTTSSLYVFLKDTNQFIAVILQFGFWLTPLVWPLHAVPEKYRTFVQINPLCYIVGGYRDALIGTTWFWEKPFSTLYFWSVTAVMIVIGALLFARLRPHFADVL